MSWEAIGGIAALLGLALAIPATWTSLRDWWNQSEKARQQLLDALPNPLPRPIQIAGQGTDQAEVDYVMANSLDISGLNARLAAPTKTLQKAVRQLIEEGKIEVFILEGLVEGGELAGKKILVPHFFKGGMRPSLRPSPEKLQLAIGSIHGER
jgi:hypothetical protein